MFTKLTKAVLRLTIVVADLAKEIKRNNDLEVEAREKEAHAMRVLAQQIREEKARRDALKRQAAEQLTSNNAETPTAIPECPYYPRTAGPHRIDHVAKGLGITQAEAGKLCTKYDIETVKPDGAHLFLYHDGVQKLWQIICKNRENK